MLKIEFTKSTIKKLEKKLKIAKKIGNIGQIQKVCAILMLAKEIPFQTVTEIWCICDKTLYNWINDFLCYRFDCSYQKGKYTPVQADPEQREQWFTVTWPEVLTKVKSFDAHLLFVDEVSFPLWGSLGRTWARKGEQPLVKTSGRRQNLKVFGAIEYFTGKLVYQAEEKRLSAKTYVKFFKTLLKRFEGPIIVILDGATYHRGVLVKEFLATEERLECYQLPKYSPDYNPIEDLWKKAKSRVNGKYFPTFRSLKKSVHDAMLYFQRNVSEILAIRGVYAKLVSSTLPEAS